jgi:hypothetical protein
MSTLPCRQPKWASCILWNKDIFLRFVFLSIKFRLDDFSKAYARIFWTPVDTTSVPTGVRAQEEWDLQKTIEQIFRFTLQSLYPTLTDEMPQSHDQPSVFDAEFAVTRLMRGVNSR